MPESQPMTESMFYILLALLKPGHGYGIMQRILELSKGRIHMGPGTLYGILTRMRKEGLISLDSEENRRKIYSITEAGKKALQEEYRRLQLMVADGRILEDGFPRGFCWLSFWFSWAAPFSNGHRRIPTLCLSPPTALT